MRAQHVLSYHPDISTMNSRTMGKGWVRTRNLKQCLNIQKPFKNFLLYLLTTVLIKGNSSGSGQFCKVRTRIRFMDYIQYILYMSKKFWLYSNLQNGSRLLWHIVHKGCRSFRSQQMMHIIDFLFTRVIRNLYMEAITKLTVLQSEKKDWIRHIKGRV